MPNSGAAPARTISTTSAFTINQNGTELIIAKFRAKQLIGNVEVETLEADNPDGYQRDLKKKRIQALDAFVRSGNPIPPALILSVRHKPRKTAQGVYEFVLPLIVIDGQHRIGGLELAMIADAKFGDFEFVVVVVYCPKQEVEAKLFIDINHAQKAVSKDYGVAVAHNLNKTAVGKKFLATDPVFGKDSDINTKAYTIALKLNSDGGILPCPNPLQSRIKLLTEQPPTYSNPITAGTVTRSLETILSMDLDQRSVGTYVLAYWRGISIAYRKPVQNYKDSVILRNLGMEIFHRVFPTVYNVLVALKGDPTNPLHYAQILELGKVTGPKDNDWMTFGRFGKIGGSYKTISTVAQEIKGSIEKSQFSLQLKGLV